jgi:hypothetical protein
LFVVGTKTHFAEYRKCLCSYQPNYYNLKLVHFHFRIGLVTCNWTPFVTVVRFLSFATVATLVSVVTVVTVVTIVTYVRVESFATL